MKYKVEQVRSDKKKNLNFQEKAYYRISRHIFDCDLTDDPLITKIS